MKTSPVTIVFQAKPYVLNGHLILAVPKEESIKLPSRGQLSVTGSMNGHEFQIVLEPDGYWSHWMRIDEPLRKAAGIQPGETVKVGLTTSTVWPEPDIPKDFKAALGTAPQSVKEKWNNITPMARWEWIRWLNATRSQETRKIRIEKTISKLAGKHRRPCCFNLAACTDPELSRGGRLIAHMETPVR